MQMSEHFESIFMITCLHIENFMVSELDQHKVIGAAAIVLSKAFDFYKLLTFLSKAFEVL